MLGNSTVLFLKYNKARFIHNGKTYTIRGRGIHGEKEFLEECGKKYGSDIVPIIKHLRDEMRNEFNGFCSAYEFNRLFGKFALLNHVSAKECQFNYLGMVFKLDSSTERFKHSNRPIGMMVNWCLDAMKKMSTVRALNFEEIERLEKMNRHSESDNEIVLDPKPEGSKIIQRSSEFFLLKFDNTTTVLTPCGIMGDFEKTNKSFTEILDIVNWCYDAFEKQSMKNKITSKFIINDPESESDYETEEEVLNNFYEQKFQNLTLKKLEYKEGFISLTVNYGLEDIYIMLSHQDNNLMWKSNIFKEVSDNGEEYVFQTQNLYKYIPYSVLDDFEFSLFDWVFRKVSFNKSYSLNLEQIDKCQDSRFRSAVQTEFGNQIRLDDLIFDKNHASFTTNLGGEDLKIEICSDYVCANCLWPLKTEKLIKNHNIEKYVPLDKRQLFADLVRFTAKHTCFKFNLVLVVDGEMSEYEKEISKVPNCEIKAVNGPIIWYLHDDGLRRRYDLRNKPTNQLEREFLRISKE